MKSIFKFAAVAVAVEIILTKIAIATMVPSLEGIIIVYWELYFTRNDRR